MRRGGWGMNDERIDQCIQFNIIMIMRTKDAAGT